VSKTFVLDTNVLLEDPRALFRFKDHIVAIPYEVLHELDHNKKRQDLAGHNARETIRELDRLRQHGSLSAGVSLEEGGSLFICQPHPNARNHDESIMLSALTMKGEGKSVTLITNDIALRVMAETHDIPSQSYEWNGHKNVREVYTGAQRIQLTSEELDQFYASSFVKLDPELQETLYPHQFLIAKDPMGRSAIGRYHREAMKSLLVHEKTNVGGIFPKNKEQQFALELLMDKNIPLVTLIGSAGCGKSLMAAAAGVEQVIDHRHYEKILVSRPITPMGRDMGYLPGSLEEKMNPWIQPIKDALRLLIGKDKRTMELKFSDGTIEVEALSYIRGRSIPNAYMIIDEAQNLSVPEMKAIVTRMGPGSKLVITGDIEQVDRAHFDSHTNGLAYLIEKMKDQEVCGHITLLKGERSDLASLAAKIL